MDCFASELASNDQLSKATMNSIHQELGKSIANRLQVDSELQSITNAVGQALQVKFGSQAYEIE